MIKAALAAFFMPVGFGLLHLGNTLVTPKINKVLPTRVVKKRFIFIYVYET